MTAIPSIQFTTSSLDRIHKKQQTASTDYLQVPDNRSDSHSLGRNSPKVSGSSTLRRSHTSYDSLQDSSLEVELRALLEGPRWDVAYKDFQRLAHRVTLGGSRATNESSLLEGLAEALEPTETQQRLKNELVANPSLRSCDRHAMQHLIDDVLTTDSRTARIVRTLTQSVVIIASFYMYQNLFEPAGVLVRDVEGEEGWQIAVNVEQGKAVHVTHIRKERSIPSSSDAFRLEWSIHLSFDSDAVFQGAMLKLLSFQLTDADSMDSNRISFLNRHFCFGNEIVVEQSLCDRTSTYATLVQRSTTNTKPFGTLPFIKRLPSKSASAAAKPTATSKLKKFINQIFGKPPVMEK